MIDRRVGTLDFVRVQLGFEMKLLHLKHSVGGCPVEPEARLQFSEEDRRGAVRKVEEQLASVVLLVEAGQ